MTLYDETKMTELKHATTLHGSLTNENRHKLWQPGAGVQESQAHPRKFFFCENPGKIP